MAAMRIVAVFCAILTLVGCGRSSGVPDSESNPDGSGRGAGIDIKVPGAHVKASASGVSLPKDFPEDVAIYPGATVVHSNVLQGGKARMIQLTLQTADDVEKLSLFYEKKLKDDKWTIASTSRTAESAMIHGKKKDKDAERHLQVTILKNKRGGSTIMLSTGTK